MSINCICDRKKGEKMSCQKLLQQLIIITIVAVLFAACGGPECALECSVDKEKYLVDITCESGAASCQIERSTALGPNGELIKFTRNDVCTYENSGNTYKIEGEINFGKNEEIDNYRFVVTGGVFGENPQICESP